MNKEKRMVKIMIVVIIFMVTIVSSIIIKQILSSTVDISIFCKSTNDIGVVLYADNCTEGYPFGSGGTCLVVPLSKGDEIQEIKYTISKGTENKIRFDFDIHESTDVAISKIEIKYPSYKKVLNADEIVNLFLEVNEDNFSSDGMVIISSTNEIASICCLDYSNIRKIVSLDWSYIFKCLAIVFMILFCAYILFILYFNQDRIHYNRFSQNIIIFISAIIIAYIVLIFEKESLGVFSNNNIPIKVLVWNIIIIWWCILGVRCFSNFKISILLVSVIIALIECINYFKMILRQENFLPWDIRIAREAMRVTNLSELPWNSWLLLLIGLPIAVLIVIGPLKLNDYSRLSLKTRLISVCVLFLLGMQGGKEICTKNVFPMYQFDISGSYNRNGMILSFIYFCQNAGDTRPEGYSMKSVNDIVEEVNVRKKERTIEEVSPNIIMIMSESFWNPEILTEVKYSEHFMERYKTLSKNACNGNVLSPVFGGGTCDAEFEALTGFSMNYIQNGLMPYIGVIQDDFFSIAHFLNSKGYNTVAMHPNTGSYYRREKIYPYLGFQRTIFGNEFEQDVARSWFISDNSVVDKIIEVYSQNKINNENPQFIFAVTIQNHQPYGVESSIKNDVSSFESENLGEDIIKGLEDFSAGINLSSDALGKLIDYFSNCDEPTIVIYWGDHMSSIGSGYDLAYKTGYLKYGDNADYYMYLTPIIVWDNYKGINESLKTRSTFQILPTVFTMYDLEMSRYFEFLNDLQNVSLGESHHKIVLDSEGVVDNNLNNELNEKCHQLELLQYDYIYGNRYAKQLFDT